MEHLAVMLKIIDEEIAIPVDRRYFDDELVAVDEAILRVPGAVAEQQILGAAGGRVRRDRVNDSAEVRLDLRNLQGDGMPLEQVLQVGVDEAGQTPARDMAG